MSGVVDLPMQKILDLEQRMAAVEAKVMPKKEEPDKEHEQRPAVEQHPIKDRK